MAAHSLWACVAVHAVSHAVVASSEQLRDCVGVKDGIYTLWPLGGGGPSVAARCSDGWVIVDPSLRNSDSWVWSGWGPLFHGFERYVPDDVWTTGNFRPFFGPRKADLRAGRFSSFRSWSRLPRHAQLTTSADCRTIAPNPSLAVYYATGNYVQCAYANRACDMEPRSGRCQRCHGGTDLPTAAPTAGACTHLALSPATDYTWATPKLDCSNFWNRLPAIGGVGRWCVAFRLDNARSRQVSSRAGLPALQSPSTPSVHSVDKRGAAPFADCTQCQKLFNAFSEQMRDGTGACGHAGKGNSRRRLLLGESCPDGCQALIDAVFIACVGTHVTFNGIARGFCEDAGFGNLLGVSIMRRDGPSCNYARGRVRCLDGPWCNTPPPTAQPTRVPTNAPTPYRKQVLNTAIMLPTQAPTKVRSVRPRACTLSSKLYDDCKASGGCCLRGDICSLKCGASSSTLTRVHTLVPTPAPSPAPTPSAIPTARSIKLQQLRCGVDEGCTNRIRRHCSQCCNGSPETATHDGCLGCVSMRCGGMLGREREFTPTSRSQLAPNLAALAPAWLHLAKSSTTWCRFTAWRNATGVPCSVTCGPGVVVQTRSVAATGSKCNVPSTRSKLLWRTKSCNVRSCAPAQVGSALPLLEGLRCGDTTAVQWRLLGSRAIYAWVDASSCIALWQVAAMRAINAHEKAQSAWTKAGLRPQVVASLVGDSSHWELEDSHRIIYDTTLQAGGQNAGFRVVLVHPRLRAEVLLLRATKLRWRVSWIGEASKRAGNTISGSTGWAIETFSHKTTDQAGFSVFVDVDTSPSGMPQLQANREVPPHYFVTVRGRHGLLTARALGGRVVYHPTHTGFRTYVVYDRPIRAWDAEKWGWVISWLAVPFHDPAAGFSSKKWHQYYGDNTIGESSDVKVGNTGGGVLGIFTDVTPAQRGSHFLREPTLVSSVSTSSLMHWHVSGQAAIFGASDIFPHQTKMRVDKNGWHLRKGYGGFRLYLRHAKFPKIAQTYDWRVHYVGYDGSLPCAVSRWAPWQTCTRSCGGGTRVRVRKVTRKPVAKGYQLGLGLGSWPLGKEAVMRVARLAWPQLGKCPALHQHATCNVQSCGAQACVVARWGRWSTCTHSCGRDGEQQSRRKVLQRPLRGGLACPSLRRVRNCNQVLCPRDCVVAQWGRWQGCVPSPLKLPKWAKNDNNVANSTDLSRTEPEIGAWECALGTQLRVRTVTVHPKAGGCTCPVLHQLRSCVRGRACAGRGDSRLCGGITSATIRHAAEHTVKIASSAQSLGLLPPDSAEAANKRLRNTESRHEDWGWRRFGSEAIYIDVNTSSCGFGVADTSLTDVVVPQYVVSVVGLETVPFFEMMRGSVSILRSTPDSFRLLVWVPALRARFGLRYASASGFGGDVARPWRVTWMGDVGQNSGATMAGSTHWQDIGMSSIYVAVNTSKAHFSKPSATFDGTHKSSNAVRYFAMLHGTRMHWRAEGVGAIRGASPQGFKLYLATNIDKAMMQATTSAHIGVGKLADAWGWTISWVGLSAREDTAHAKASLSSRSGGMMGGTIVGGVSGSSIPGHGWCDGELDAQSTACESQISRKVTGGEVGRRALFADVRMLQLALFPSPQPIVVANIITHPDCALCWAPVGLQALDRITSIDFRFYQASVKGSLLPRQNRWAVAYAALQAASCLSTRVGVFVYANHTDVTTAKMPSDEQLLPTQKIVLGNYGAVGSGAACTFVRNRWKCPVFELPSTGTHNSLFLRAVHAKQTPENKVGRIWVISPWRSGGRALGCVSDRAPLPSMIMRPWRLWAGGWLALQPYLRQKNALNPSSVSHIIKLSDVLQVGCDGRLWNGSVLWSIAPLLLTCTAHPAPQYEASAVPQSNHSAKYAHRTAPMQHSKRHKVPNVIAERSSSINHNKQMTRVRALRKAQTRHNARRHAASAMNNTSTPRTTISSANVTHVADQRRARTFVRLHAALQRCDRLPTSLRDACKELVQLKLTGSMAPTAAPTQAPTHIPTPLPTHAPTRAPTPFGWSFTWATDFTLNVRGEVVSTFDSSLQAILCHVVANVLSDRGNVKDNFHVSSAVHVKSSQVRVLAIHSDDADGCGSSDTAAINDDDVSARHAELTCLVLQVRFAGEQSARHASRQLKSARFARLLSAQLSTVARLKWHGSTDFSVSSSLRDVQRVQPLSGAHVAPLSTTTPPARQQSELVHPIAWFMIISGIAGYIILHRARQSCKQNAMATNGVQVQLRSEVAPLRTAAVLAQSQSRPTTSRLDEEVMI